MTQPLLYRYFPDKDALIERVFSEVLTSSWDATWEQLLSDRSRPLIDRIIDFYTRYTDSTFRHERVRLLMFASLRDHDTASRYLGFVRAHLFVPLVREFRAGAGLPDDAPITEEELECVAGLHGAIGYVVACRSVKGGAAPSSARDLVAQQVGTFLNGVANALSALQARSTLP